MRGYLDPYLWWFYILRSALWWCGSLLASMEAARTQHVVCHHIVLYRFLTLFWPWRKELCLTGCDLQDMFWRPSPIPIVVDGKKGKKRTIGASVSFGSACKNNTVLPKIGQISELLLFVHHLWESLLSSLWAAIGRNEQTVSQKKKILQRQPECCPLRPTLQAQVKL